MQFDSFSAFLDMGGYGLYVWLSYGVSSALIIALIISSIFGHKKVIKNIAMRQHRENKLRKVRQDRKNAQIDSAREVSNESTS